jgi:hypothetical protein
MKVFFTLTAETSSPLSVELDLELESESRQSKGTTSFSEASCCTKQAIREEADGQESLGDATSLGDG